MCLVTTAAIRETSGETIYQELGFESIKTHIGKKKILIIPDFNNESQTFLNSSRFL